MNLDELEAAAMGVAQEREQTGRIIPSPMAPDTVKGSYTITIQDIRDLGPCYDPKKYLPEGWQGTLVDILDVKQCPGKDRIWVVTGFLDDKTNRLFAVWCARQALKLVENPDPRSIAACDVAERYANGEATKEELQAASDAANAASDAANAARYAADAVYAARYAARAAAYAASDAANAAGDAANAARDAQIKKLKEMVRGGK